MCECIDKLKRSYKETIIQHYKNKVVSDTVKVEVAEQIIGFAKDLDIKECLVINIKSTFFLLKKDGSRCVRANKAENHLKMRYCPLCGEQQY